LRSGGNNHTYTEQAIINFSNAQKKKHIEDPLLKTRISLSLKLMNAARPELGRAHSEKMKVICSNPIYREKISKIRKDMFLRNPDLAISHGKRMRELIKNNPDILVKMSNTSKLTHKNNPDLAKQQAKSLRKYYQNPENKQKASLAQRKRFEKEIQQKKLDIINSGQLDLFTPL
jgi:hypothetical protein